MAKKYWLLTYVDSGQQIPFAMKTHSDYRPKKGTVICNARHVLAMRHIQQLETGKDAIEAMLSQFTQVIRTKIVVKQIDYRSYRKALKNEEINQIFLHRKQKKK